MAHKMSYGKGYNGKKMGGTSGGSKKMAGYARNEAAGNRRGESAYVEHRKVSKGPYVPR